VNELVKKVGLIDIGVTKIFIATSFVDNWFISGLSFLSVFYISLCFGINKFAMPACYASLVPEVS